MTAFLGIQGVLSEDYIEALLHEVRTKNIRNVFVDSPGGQFEFFSRLGPALRHQGLLTLAGDVRSAAIVLFLLGHTRQAYPDATFFFHEVRTLVGQQGEVTIAELEMVSDYAERFLKTEDRDLCGIWLQQMRDAQAWFLHFLARETGVPTGTFLNLMRANAILSAKEAIQYGIIHTIVDYGEY